MLHDRFHMGQFVFEAALTCFLAFDLLVFDAVVLPTLRRLLDEACLGKTLPFMNQMFQAVVPTATRICTSDYQDKLTYAYKALTVPLLSLMVGAALLAWQVYKHRTLKESMRLTPRRLSLAILWILATVMLVYIQLGSYVRFVGDDYCTAAEAVNRGVIGATVYWYTTWVSRS